MASKTGKNKKKCEQYRMSGRHEINKAKKQARHKKRLEKFARRREAGLTYVYQKGNAERKLNDAMERGEDINYDPVHGIWLSNYKSDKANRTHYACWKSVCAKLQNEINKIEEEKKALMMNTGKCRHRKAKMVVASA